MPLNMHASRQCSYHVGLLLYKTVGTHKIEPALNLKRGQKMAVASSNNLTTTFSAAIIEEVMPVAAPVAGKYVPAIEHPYLVVDAIVMAL
jgi:hypothetical protein